MSIAESTPIPVTALLPRRPPEQGESWRSYRDDTLNRLGRFAKRLEAMGLEPEPLISASALRFDAEPDQLQHLKASAEDIELIELDPLLEATAMDEVPQDIELPPFCAQHPGVDGEGVAVAVLDTGVDSEHPQLKVAESFPPATSRSRCQANTAPTARGSSPPRTRSTAAWHRACA